MLTTNPGLLTEQEVERLREQLALARRELGAAAQPERSADGDGALAEQQGQGGAARQPRQPTSVAELEAELHHVRAELTRAKEERLALKNT